MADGLRVGDRVRPSQAAVDSKVVLPGNRMSVLARNRRTSAMRGTIVGFSRSYNCYLVRWDGRKNPSPWNKVYVDKVEDSNGESNSQVAPTAGVRPEQLQPRDPEP